MSQLTEEQAQAVNNETSPAQPTLEQTENNAQSLSMAEMITQMLQTSSPQNGGGENQTEDELTRLREQQVRQEMRFAIQDRIDILRESYDGMTRNEAQQIVLAESSGEMGNAEKIRQKVMKRLSEKKEVESKKEASLLHTESASGSAKKTTEMLPNTLTEGVQNAVNALR